jgi:hypothetical protein
VSVGDLSPRLRRLAEELDEAGLPPETAGDRRAVLLEEVDRALRPPVHERRVPSAGTILDPSSDPTTWEGATGLEIARAPVEMASTDDGRRYADGLSSWLVRHDGEATTLLMFDRPAGSERDLVVLARSFAATMVQRHPSGSVRIVGGFGVLRWDGLTWHHEPPVGSWIDVLTTCSLHGDADVLTALIEFAVHDLGAAGIGALLVYRPSGSAGPPVEERLGTPPPLQVGVPYHLAPLRHSLSQLDGAAFFDADGVLRRLGVRLVPSTDAEQAVDAFGGTRHTSGRRYSHDDPASLVIAVSEDGPVTVFAGGKLRGRSPDDRT